MHDHTEEAQRLLGVTIKSATKEGLSTNSPRHNYITRGDI